MSTSKAAHETLDEAILRIAKQIFEIETLKTRNSDALDFHEVSVWGLRNALRLAYEAGRSDALRAS